VSTEGTGSSPANSLIEFSGGFARLLRDILRDIVRRPLYFRLILDQVFFIGVNSFLLVSVTGLATGSVMALQFGFGLSKFGGTLYVPKITSLSILREMGPVFTSLLVAGRIGSGIAAEVSSMKVTQQLDAIRALGTSPIKRIVIPRLVACMIALPLLTLFSDYISLWGAMIICKLELGIGQSFFIAKTLETVTSSDLFSGMLKTLVFAFFIAITACWKGFNTEGGTEGVGNSTTWVVVTSSIFILVSDFFLTKLFILTLYAQR
jgi:phospholipid/cholesterol/gamma-HCH transport system permease protein